MRVFSLTTSLALGGALVVAYVVAGVGEIWVGPGLRTGRVRLA